jgi:hypothetical protein
MILLRDAEFGKVQPQASEPGLAVTAPIVCVPTISTANEIELRREDGWKGPSKSTRKG